MHPFRLASSVLAVSLVLGTPSLVVAHVGHGDEFQAEGGINRVKVNPETDPILGIQVKPIEPAADGSAAVLVPVTALVDADGKRLAFVQYENFYEPVPVTTGATKGELIEVTDGLSVGEKLVIQGSLSLYAESRKTQTAESAASHPKAAPTDAPAQNPAATETQTNAPASTQAAVPGQSETAQQPGGFPVSVLVAIVGGIALIVGAIAALGISRKKKGTFSSKDGSF